MTASNRKAVLSRLQAASRQRLAEANRLDAEIAGTLRHLVRLLVRRSKVFGGPSLPLGPECTDHVLSPDELRRLIRARAASRSDFCRKIFFSVVQDALRGESESCVYPIVWLFRTQDDRPKSEVVRRDTVPLIDLLTEMLAREKSS